MSSPSHSPEPQRICLILHCTDDARASEAGRAAVGLTLRGAALDVLVGSGAGGAGLEQALSTLRALGHRVQSLASADLAASVRAAHVTEVWT